MVRNTRLPNYLEASETRVRKSSARDRRPGIGVAFRKGTGSDASSGSSGILKVILAGCLVISVLYLIDRGIYSGYYFQYGQDFAYRLL
jgi:hypothetical protein